MSKKILIILILNILLLTSAYSSEHSYNDQNGIFQYKKKDTDIENTEFNDFMEDTAIAYGGIWFSRLFYVRNKNSRIFDTSFGDWIDNITRLPVANDGDSFFTNYVVHPGVGAMYYMYYRENGYNYWQSAVGSLLLSTLFEYTVEGLVEPPSLPDLIATPGVGVPIGFVADTLSDWLESKDNTALKVASHIVNPFKNIIRDGKVVAFNPVSGTFQFTGEFQKDWPPAKDISLNLDYPLFFEPAIPSGYIRAFIEVADVDPELGGEFIFYHVKAEFPSRSNLYSFYIRGSQAGVNNVSFEGEEIGDGFEFANLLLGSKFVILKTEDSVLTIGFETIVPTAYKDNRQRLETLLSHSRDFPLYLRNSVTLSPYLSFAKWKGYLSFQSNVGTDFILNADILEDDFLEWRVKYSFAFGLNIPVDYNPTFFLEFDGLTLATADNFESTDLFITPGFRIGERIAPGFAVQIPVKGQTASISDASFIFDVKLRF